MESGRNMEDVGGLNSAGCRTVNLVCVKCVEGCELDRKE